MKGDKDTLSVAGSQLNDFYESLPINYSQNEDVNWNFNDELSKSPLSEAFTIPTQVNYVGCGGNIFKTGSYLLK